jgi:hypothetical protein
LGPSRLMLAAANAAAAASADARCPYTSSSSIGVGPWTAGPPSPPPGPTVTAQGLGAGRGGQDSSAKLHEMPPSIISCILAYSSTAATYVKPCHTQVHTCQTLDKHVFQDLLLLTVVAKRIPHKDRTPEVTYPCPTGGGSGKISPAR